MLVLKIYLQNDEEVAYYRDLGIPIHEGPRGGVFIYSEDLEAVVNREKFDGSVDLNVVLNDLFSGFGGEKISFKKGNKVYVGVKNGNKAWGIFLSHDKVFGIWGSIGDYHFDGWSIRADNPVNFVIGSRLLISALNDLKSGNYKKRAERVFKNTGGLFGDLVDVFDDLRVGDYSSILLSLIINSLDLGLAHLDGDYFVDDVYDGEDLSRNLFLVFGPWIFENVFHVEDVGVGIDTLSDRSFYENLGRILIISGLLGRVPKFNFVSKSTIMEVSSVKINSDGLYVRGERREIYLPIDKIEVVKEHGFIGILWHEFQHFLFDVLDLDERNIGFFAYRLAMQGKLTQYARTNDNEALSELFALNAEGKVVGEDILKSYAGIIRDYLGRRL